MVTIKDVAKAAGVGLGTASRALNGTGSVSQKSKDKIMDAAKKLGYFPNQIARNLKKQTTGCVALIIPTIFHVFFSKFAYYCESALYEKGYRMIVVNSQDNPEKEISMLDMIKQQRVDGIIFSTHYAYEGIDATSPIVMIDGHLGDELPCVTSNNYQASYQAVSYLYNHGARKIGCISGTTEAFSETSHRYQAYIDCMKSFHMEERLYKLNFKHGQEAEVVHQFLLKYPDVDAIFASSDTLALLAYKELKSMGKRIPEDVQIIGFDGIMNYNYVEAELTTVQQDIEKMARIAVDLLIKRINGEETPRRIEVETIFKIEGTTLN